MTINYKIKDHKGVYMNKISINIISTCLWCEKEIPFSQNMQGKLLCSMKCLRDTTKACEEQNGKGSCGYDKSDVITKPKLYKQTKIKKPLTEAKQVRLEGRG